MSEAPPRVFVVFEQPKFDYSSAEQFGDVHFVLTQEFSGLTNTMSPRDLDRYRRVQAFVATYRPESDFVVFTGAPTLMATVAAMLARRHDRFRALRWDNSQGRYAVVSVALDTIEKALAGGEEHGQ